MQSVNEQAALESACAMISRARAQEMLCLLNWKHGGCLSVREPPDVAGITTAERQVVQAVWDAIPDGSSSWMTAFYRILSHVSGDMT